MTKTNQWLAGGALVCVLILVAGFLLLVQPQRSEAAELREATIAQEDSAAALQTKLAQLKAQEKDLPRQLAKLEEIRTRLPETPALPSLVRSLTDSSEIAGVGLITVAPSAPVEVAPQVATAPVQPEAATSGDATDTAAAARPAATPVAQQTLMQIPLQIEVIGSYAELTQFLTQMEGLQRSMLVTSVAISEEAEADDASGELTMTLGAAVFMTSEQAEEAASTLTPNQAPSAASVE